MLGLAPMPTCSVCKAIGHHAICPLTQSALEFDKLRSQLLACQAALAAQAMRYREALKLAEKDFADIDKCKLLSIARDIATDGLRNVRAALSSGREPSKPDGDDGR